MENFLPWADIARCGLIDPSSGKELATLSGHADYVRSIAFSPDGKMLAAGGGPPQRSGEIKIWDLQSHQLLKTMQGHKDCIYSIAWSPDGKIIASGSYDKTVKLWDVASGKELKNLQDHIDAVFALAFSPDGKHLASASQDRTVKIWDVASRKTSVHAERCSGWSHRHCLFAFRRADRRRRLRQDDLYLEGGGYRGSAEAVVDRRRGQHSGFGLVARRQDDHYRILRWLHTISRCRDARPAKGYRSPAGMGAGAGHQPRWQTVWRRAASTVR